MVHAIQYGGTADKPWDEPWDEIRWRTNRYTMHAVQCGTVWYNAVQCGTVRYNAVQCGTIGMV